MLLTYDAIMVTTIVTVARPNVLDVLAPFLLGLGEFLQFTVLTFSGDSAGSGLSAGAQLSQISWWPLVAALTSLAGRGLVANYERHLRVSMQQAPPELEPGYHWLAKILRTDKVMTVLIAAILLVALAVLWWGSPERSRVGGPARLSGFRRKRGIPVELRDRSAEVHRRLGG